MALHCNIFLSKINRSAQNTQIILCGCATKDSPPIRFPPAGTVLSCLATGPVTTLAKRTQVFQKDIGSLRVTCNVDTNLNPFQDCLNTMRYYCDPARGSLYMSDCKVKVDAMTNEMNRYWQTWHHYCDKASWVYSAKQLTPGISSCAAATASLKAYAKYEGVSVPDAVITTAKEALWDKIQ